jgi:signal transduction histidine kinase
MSKKSLASVLKLQWWIHTLLTSLFFIAVAFFFLFVIEDYFNEKQLNELSNIVSMTRSVEGMPGHIQIYNLDQAPQSWLAQLELVAPNKAIEIDSLQGEAMHIVLSTFEHSEEKFILALDTAKTNSIWDITDELLLLILPWMLIFLALASFLVKKFTRVLQGQFKCLLATIADSESPDDLERFSQTQPISELAQFAQLFSEVWLQKVEILTREKQSLEYLSHELRTPIQSSLATLELLALKTDDKKAIDRLVRSLNRMTRLSSAILHLMETEQLPPLYAVDALAVCQLLVDELKPLAEAKKQSFIVQTETTTQDKQANEKNRCTGDNENEISSGVYKIYVTQEVIEILLSIMLTNALQHSNSHPIVITINTGEISIKNEMKTPTNQSNLNCQPEKQHGFGIGLKIAKRLADKFNLQLDIECQNNKSVVATISN